MPTEPITTENQMNSAYTVGDLKRDLALYADDMEIYFEGFSFYRLKMRGEKLLQIELNEKEA